MAIVYQPSFSGGVLTPKMWGRTDLDIYRRGLRTAKNFFISRHGAAVSRPGTKFITELKTYANFDESWTYRLIPFSYSQGINYLLVFGGGPEGGYIWVVENDRLWDDGFGNPFEISTPYTATQVRELKYAQQGAFLFITHQEHEPHELILRDNSFLFHPIDYSLFPFPTPVYLEAPLPISGEAREWRWQVTLLLEEEDTGYRFETAPYLINSSYQRDPQDPTQVIITELDDHKFALSNTTPAIIHVSQDGLPIPGHKILGWVIYRGHGSLFGKVGETTFNAPKGGGHQWFDYGDEPDWLSPPPSGNALFYKYEPDDFEFKDNLVAKEHPRVVAFFNQRAILASTKERPDHIWVSALNDYYNFDEKKLTTDTSAFPIVLASRKFEPIQAMVGLDNLLVFTDSSIWAIGYSQAFSNVDVQARLQEEIGCNGRDPLYVGDGLLYVRKDGFGVRNLRYREERRGYAGQDVSFMADHLLEGYNVLDWCFARDPWGLVWAVRSDGKLLSLTYAPETGTIAWAEHETEGVVMAVAALPQPKEDAVYMVVRRQIGSTTRFYLERMAPRTIYDVKEAVCLDSALTFQDEEALASVSIPHLAGMEVYALVDGNVQGPFTVTPTGDVDLTVPGNLVTIGLRYVCDLELLDVPEARERWKNVKKVTWELEGSRGIQTGKSFDSTLYEHVDRTVAMGFGHIPAESDYRAEIIIASGWTKHGRAVLRQTYPLPVTVLGASREGEVI